MTFYSDSYRPPYTNAIFYPALSFIDAISQSTIAIVTTTTPHGYISGIIVRLVVPLACGMQQIDQYYGPIKVTGPTTFTVDVDSTTYDVFTIPANPNPAWANIKAMVIPIGELTKMLIAAERNVTR